MIYFYLKDRKECVKINSTYNEIVSGVPQGSILGPILFNLSISDLFFFIEIANMYNFADDDTLSAWGEIVSKLIDLLESESNIAIDWCTKHKIIINQENCRRLFLIERNLILQIFHLFHQSKS